MKLSIKRPETTVDLCLDGSLHAEWRKAQLELERVQKQNAGDDRLNTPARAIAERIESIQEAMRAEVVTFTVRALPRNEWSGLVESNPPREGNKLDAEIYGFNLAAVMGAAIPACIVKAEQHGEPLEFNPNADWDALADDMTDAQYEDFMQAVLQVNRGRQDVPFSYAALREIQSSAGS
jgi:hypothetical protein